MRLKKVLKTFNEAEKRLSKKKTEVSEIDQKTGWIGSLVSKNTQNIVTVVPDTHTVYMQIHFCKVSINKL